MKKLIKGLKFEFFAIYLYICSFNEILYSLKMAILKKQYSSIKIPVLLISQYPQQEIQNRIRNDN